uniref:DNA replication ATP-dependent helicase/nuclease n=1 Tax=Plectus sambesii TaxID=2011161 RepID=A0A914UN63_9BILA
PVVAATCLQAANHLLFGSRRFDYVIIDEATLSLQSACLGPLLVADRFVLVGDPKQLRPIVQCRTARQEGMGDTLFEQLEERNESAVVCLRHQYRMNSEIARLSSELFYNGELQCATDSIASSTLTFAGTKSPPTDSPLWIRAALKTVLESSVLFVDTRSTDADRLDYRASNDGPGLTCNRGEAAAVLRLCDALIQAGVKASDVGVICIYRHQTNVIRKALCLTDIEVNTADQYQGRDKAVIIVSLVWTAPIDDENKKSDLLIDERRVNVALTRAKQKLILLGCRHSVVRHKVIADLLNIMRPDQLCTLE